MTELPDYIEAHTTAEDDYLRRLRRATNIHLVRPHMVTGHVEGMTLRLLTAMIRPQSVLEIGTYSGYSAIAISLGLGKDGHIYTFDINDEIADFARQWIEGSPRAEAITAITGDVLSALPDFARAHGDLRFDMIFIDGNKREYTDYYRLSREYIRPGGFILADNTLWDGHIVDPAYDHDAQTRGIRAFNDMVSSDESVEQVILPLRDGLTIIKV